MKILLHENSLNLRGTSVAVYDYAYFLKKFFNYECIITYNKNNPTNDAKVIKKFQNEFEIIEHSDFNDIDPIIKNKQIDFLYIIKAGDNDGKVSKLVKTGVHAVFKQTHEQVHGDVYAFVSEWLAKECSNNTLPFVPHMLHMPVLSKEDNFRKALNIPDDAIVYGRYGGVETFDIIFVRNAITNIIKNNSKIYFLFCNTQQFINHPQVIFTNTVASLDQKVKFINTCDAMIHARYSGETFGLSIIEFMSQNKPVLTYGSSPEKNHYWLLQDKGLLYNTYEELYELFVTYKPEPIIYNNLKDYSPEVVINKFKDVFFKTNE